MKNYKPLLHSFGHALSAFLYISLVAWVLFNGQRLFGKIESFRGPLALLLLFVISAVVVGTLVLGRPIILFLEGRKSEALRFFGYTLGWLLVFALIVFVVHF